ncbi:MAG: nitroreductase family protein [Candidatus Thalassarchaeaceae archaeon]|nr:nitroreductase family protein [Euryarchaeota archaeon]OUW78329.1 MAG: nitroreductase family protein [Euryarchaeota archaeon TMED215]|tara:strand:+ start:1115 stop:1795 length:681 start_codon:yes stop_codon:yes gene_type:complete
MSKAEEEPGFTTLEFVELLPEEMSSRADKFYEMMDKRRTTRHFSDRDVPRKLIERAIQTAGTSPSGAHLQPWTFVAVSNPEIKMSIREAAEREEMKTYSERMPESWAEVLRPLGTDHIKEHLTEAPWVVILFRQSKRIRGNGEWAPTYYSQESCGIAAGLFISAVHNMGLVTLTHTPSPMGFLRDILQRPDHEHAMLVLPVGFPAENASIPNISRKTLEEISEFFE